MAANHSIILSLPRHKWSACALAAWIFSALLPVEASQAQQPMSVFNDEIFAQPFAEVSQDDCVTCDPDAAAFDSWDDIVGQDDTSKVYWNDPQLKPFDWVRHMGFRHSSTHGRHVGRGLPLEGTSWRNRPYHIDWFSGPMLSDNLVGSSIEQDNELFGGLRIGWDFDYYWGLEARFGWSNPNVQFIEPQSATKTGSYFVSDIDIVYYPWGDSKIRPYMLAGAGMAQIDFVDSTGVNFDTTLFTTPFGVGIQFSHWRWAVWRFEVLDNLSYGADGVDTMHNVSLTAGMELRFGSHPASYWPWRSTRKIW